MKCYNKWKLKLNSAIVGRHAVIFEVMAELVWKFFISVKKKKICLHIAKRDCSEKLLTP